MNIHTSFYMSMEQENFQSAQTTNSPEDGVQQPVTAAPKQRKSRKKLYISLAILLVIVLASAAYFTVSGYLSAGDEQMAYEILENNDNPQDYEDYLEKYPDGEHAEEVRERLTKLQAMLDRWQVIQLSDNVNDFVNFKNSYDDPKYARFCDIKIDSLDFVRAQREGTEEAFARYLSVHPDGRYASEASVAQGEIRDQEISMEDRDQIMRVIADFYKGFETQDDALICSNITATMTTFMNISHATKAQVLDAVKKVFEHIESCTFQVNRDVEIERLDGKDDKPSSYKVSFTVDQHIVRETEGKTFASYQCTAIVNSQLLISSLTMNEISNNKSQQTNN